MRLYRPSAIPFDMFDPERTDAEVEAARKLEGIYHRGQARIWNGREILPELVAKHGGVRLPEGQKSAVRNLFGVIFWGELAAWKVAADLALHLDDLGAKMAATSQAHDEARHFYVMRDYLALLGEVPNHLGPRTVRVLEGTLNATDLTRKLLGMQLMIEPMALTLFQLVRARRIEPVLCDLLAFYERDEARHVALGVLHLPARIRGMGPIEAAAFYRWQIREYFAQFAMLREQQADFRALGIDPREVLRLGREKQIIASKMLIDEMGHDLPIVAVIRRVTDFKSEWDFPPDGTGFVRRFERAARKAIRDVEEIDAPLSEVA